MDCFDDTSITVTAKANANARANAAVIITVSVTVTVIITVRSFSHTMIRAYVVACVCCALVTRPRLSRRHNAAILQHRNAQMLQLQSDNFRAMSRVELQALFKECTGQDMVDIDATSEFVVNPKSLSSLMKAACQCFNSETVPLLTGSCAH